MNIVKDSLNLLKIKILLKCRELWKKVRGSLCLDTVRC
jgi:hypothetical protein